MKELLKQMAVYNVWAHKKIMDAVLSIPVEKQKAEMPSSFSNLEKTILHMWDAESIWWQRMKLHERLMIPSENFKGTTVEAVNGLLSQSALWEAWVNNVSDNMLEHVFEFRNKKGDQIKMPIWQMLTHVFNHGTYHRGQLVTMMRELGVTEIPATDFIHYMRTRV